MVRICCILKGVHFSPEIDYENSVKNYRKYITEPYVCGKNPFDIMILTYDSVKLQKLIDEYKPVKKLILEKGDNDWHSKSIKLIKEYEQEKNIQYDLIISMNFNLMFTIPIFLQNVDYSKINIPHKNSNFDEYIIVANRKFLDFEKIPEELISYMYTVTELENKFTKGYKYYYLN